MRARALAPTSPGERARDAALAVTGGAAAGGWDAWLVGGGGVGVWGVGEGAGSGAVCEVTGAEMASADDAPTAIWAGPPEWTWRIETRTATSTAAATRVHPRRPMSLIVTYSGHECYV